MQYHSQPNVVESVHSSTMNKVLRQAYMLVGISLIPTVIGAFVGVANIQLILQFFAKSPIFFMIGQLAIFYGLCFAIEKNRDNALGVFLMLGFTFLMGIMLAPLLSLAISAESGVKLIAVSAGGTGALFVALAALGSNAEKDYSNLAKFLGASFLVLMATILLNIFFLKMQPLNLIISCAIIPFSGAIIVYRINNAVRGGETSYISLALDLYIAIYNIFSAILRLLLSFTGND